MKKGQIYSQGNHHKNLLILDTGASASIFFNQELLGTIQQVNPKEFNTVGNTI